MCNVIILYDFYYDIIYNAYTDIDAARELMCLLISVHNIIIILL